jgi:uncharacterized protein (TIGR02391 family)
MVQQLQRIIGDEGALLRHSPEQLGRVIFTLLKEEVQTSGEPHRRWSMHNQVGHDKWSEYRDPDAVQHAVLEALSWLERMGLIAYGPGGLNSRFYFLTRRAQSLKDELDLESYAKAVRFPRDLLHPDIVRAAEPEFMQGDYETAVLKGFKEVEVTLRDRTGIQSTRVNAEKLVTAAAQKGLFDESIPDEEDRAKLCTYYVAAMAFFRNSTAHTRVDLSMEQAVEALSIASYLRRLIL